MLDNFLYKEYLTFLFSVNSSLKTREMNGLEIGGIYSKSDDTNIKVKLDLLNNNADITYNYRPNNKEKWTGSLNFSPENLSFGVYKFTNITNRNSEFMSIFLKTSGLFINNDCILHTKSLSLEFKSQVNFIFSNKMDSETKLKYNVIFSIAIKFERFKIQIPLIISSQNNPITNSLIFLSTIIGNSVLRIFKVYKKLKCKHIQVINKVNREKQEEFNLINNSDYIKKIEFEKEKNGLVILYAFYGEYTKILEIYKILQVFNSYKDNKDKSVFDIKIALTLHIMNSRLNLPKHLTDIEGVYLPDYLNRDMLAYTLVYVYEYNTYTIIIKDNENEFSIPG
jgi:hypothetical protein